MRRILVAILALVPPMAHAQTVLVAKATPPAALKASSSAAAASPVSTVFSPSVALVIHQAVSTGASPTENAATTPFGFAAPLLVKTVVTDLTPQELAAGSEVAVRLTVNRDGVPQDLSIDHATNPEIAKKTLAAVSQYRFKPATSSFLAIPSTVTLDIKIH
jgi:hypothetical protein